MKKARNKTVLAIALCIVSLALIVFLLAVVPFLTPKYEQRDMANNNIEHGLVSNINVLLEAPDNWEQIMTDKDIISDDIFDQIDGSTATIPITAELIRQKYGKDADVNSFFKHNTTHNAYENLVYTKVYEDHDPKTSVIFVTPPSDEETALFEKEGVETEMKPAALDGFVFITHKDNPVDSLTLDQIRDIYSGSITNWKEVGGRNEKITAYQREKNSGSQTAMENLVMQGQPMTECPEFRMINAMGQLIEMVAEYENDSCSIGYTYYYYMNYLYKSPDIKMIKIDGIAPENENLINGSYPLTTSYYAVIRAEETADSPARKLYDYITGDEGQKIIKLAGYCPLRDIK